MYKNLQIELVKKGWSILDLARESGIKYQTLINKVNGNSEFKFDECVAIKTALSSKMPLEEIFFHQ